MAGARSQRGRRVIAVVMLGLVLGVVGVMPAAAYDQTKTSGTIGVYTIEDYNGSGGVTCSYPDTNAASNANLSKIRVRGFYAHGTTISPRYVGYAFAVLRKASGGSTWSQKYLSPVVKQLASALNPTHFGARTWTLPNPPANDGSMWRVSIRLTWYASNGSTIVGSASGPVEVYRHVLVGAGNEYTIGTESSGAACKANYHF